MTFWIKEPKSGNPSVTLTAFCTGFAVATLKLLIAGVAIGGFRMSDFSGVDYAAVVGALGAVYTLRRHTSQKDA